jgi:predicted HicB family RNase H-like nuclease
MALSKKKTRPTHMFLLRLDKGLHRSLVGEAKRFERSLNSEIVWRLRKSLEAPDEAGTAA